MRRLKTQVFSIFIIVMVIALLGCNKTSPDDVVMNYAKDMYSVSDYEGVKTVLENFNEDHVGAIMKYFEKYKGYFTPAGFDQLLANSIPIDCEHAAYEAEMMLQLEDMEIIKNEERDESDDYYVEFLCKVAIQNPDGMTVETVEQNGYAIVKKIEKEYKIDKFVTKKNKVGIALSKYY